MAKSTARGDTRERILQSALALFREQGFDETTMRAIAKAAGMSLGAAYYYFPSKDAIVLAYYERIVERRVARVGELLANERDIAARLRGVYRLHFDLVAEDKNLLGALVRSVADPNSPLSIFSESTREVRSQMLALFDRVLDVDGIPEELRDLGTLGLWTLDLGLMLYFVWDRSEGQAKTRKLADGTIGLLLPLLPLLSTPFAQPALAQLAQLLLDADLVPDDEPPASG